MHYTVAIVGRPNVGKSTFFNRMIQSPSAIVHNMSGVTRDRKYGSCEWNGRQFDLIDTGGLSPDLSQNFQHEITKQVLLAIDEANLILFMVDARTGIHIWDENMLQILRRQNKALCLLVNKVDTHTELLLANEFHAFGIQPIFMLSSINGSGSGELLDYIVQQIPDSASSNTKSRLDRITIIGQPNVGKSTLLNALLGRDRSIVSAVAGTTRDTLETEYHFGEHHFLLTDTAGIRKKNKEKEDIEFYSIIRAVRAIENSDAVFLLIDASKGLTHQDLHLFEMSVKRGKGIVLLVNKWDLIDKNTNTARDFSEEIRQRLAPFKDVPILFISAQEKQRIYQAINTISEVIKRRKLRIETSKLNELIKNIISQQNPPSYRGHKVQIKYATQIHKDIPTFLFFANYPDAINLPYKNFLENRLREALDLTGVPIRLVFRKK